MRKFSLIETVTEGFYILAQGTEPYRFKNRCLANADLKALEEYFQKLRDDRFRLIVDSEIREPSRLGIRSMLERVCPKSEYIEQKLEQPRHD